MNIILRLLFKIVDFVQIFFIPFYWVNTKLHPKQKLPKIQDNLLKISATELAAKIRNKEITSEHLCTVFIDRIKEVNPILNAVVEEKFEDALIEARKIDKFLETCELSLKDLEKTKPLLGIPLTVKESCAVSGFSFSVGTLNRLDIKAEKDGEAVANLKKAGAILLLVSNTPEICLCWETKNFITGQSKNPYDTTCTTGGSSGGEGALLGAGASVIGVGSDVAGSIRLPAMFNGVFGHKPTARTIPIKGHYPYCNDENFETYFAIGPMTRYASDLRLMMKVMSNKSCLSKLKLEKEVDMSEINVFFKLSEADDSFWMSQVQPEIKNAILKSVAFLKSEHKCKTDNTYSFSELSESYETSATSLFALKDLPNLLKSDNQTLATELIKSILGVSKHTFNLLAFYLLKLIFTTLISSDSYHYKQKELQHKLAGILGEHGVLLYPTFTRSSFKHSSFIFNLGGLSYLMLANASGFPATHVPCGFDKNGLPIGIQVIAAPYQDRLCFAVAEKLEQLFGGWSSPR